MRKAKTKPPKHKMVTEATTKELDELTDEELEALAIQEELEAKERKRQAIIRQAIARRYKMVPATRTGPNHSPDEIAAREDAWE